MTDMKELHELLIKEGEAFEKMLGRLTICWADTEYSIYETLLHYARVSDPVGRALFSGDRAKPMIDMITAILENTNAPQARREDFAYVAAQIGAIQTLRDMLTHYVSSAWSSLGFAGKRLISNIARVKRKHNSLTYPVDSALIGHMCRDMRVIVTHLNRHRAKGRFKPYGPADTSAWLYKFPQPAFRQAQTRPKNPKQKRPRKSSRGK
jgi:hypothetical protein